MKSNKIKHNTKLLKFCTCKICQKQLITHILNAIDKKILIKNKKLLGKKNHKSI
jgi:hypothetical protein